MESWEKGRHEKERKRELEGKLCIYLILFETQRKIETRKRYVPFDSHSHVFAY